MNKRLATTFVIALIPAIVLAILMPDKIFNRKSPGSEMKYVPHAGADITAFVRDGCPHCADFYDFAVQNEWDVDYHEISSMETPQMFRDLQDRSLALSQGVPTIVVDGRVFQGYDTHDTSGAGLKQVYDACKASADGCMPYKDFIKAGGAKVEVEMAKDGTCTEHCEGADDKYKFDLWIFGEVNLLDYSLVGLSLLLGALDGFNPCAMWVLITLLTLLINTNDWKKIWIVGGTFLFVSGAMYYMFIAAWLNVFLLIGLNAIVQIVIGLVALGGGAFYLYEAFGKDPNQCHVTNLSQRQRTIARMKELIMSKTQWPALIIGVAILAISVNMIELVCTAGLPAVFTQILALNNVSNLARYGYIGLFIMMYMIDDLIIFGIAITTLKATGLTTKYRRFTLIFGGFLMYGLGILLIFFPDMLTFQAH